MVQVTAQIAAKIFLDDYSDPEIEKRLYYEVWADRNKISDSKRIEVWQEVRRLTHRLAAKTRAEGGGHRTRRLAKTERTTDDGSCTGDGVDSPAVAGT